MNSREEDIAWLKSTFRPIPRPTLPDDCIEYCLYIIDSSLDKPNQSELKLKLKNVRKHVNDLQKQWLQDYIWQRQSFGLDIVDENGVTFLRGRTEYGDSIEDEWVIVWLLRELTKTFTALWVKVTDSDGEFLLIEASGTLPPWLEPDVAENRVWIHQGQLKIIKPIGNLRSSKHTDEKLTLEQAHQCVISEPKRIMHSSSMEEEAFYRLRNYPGQIKENMHNAILQVPRKVVFLLLQRAAYVAPAIEAFYLRDPISLKPLQAKDGREDLIFSPDDLVELSIKFPRVAYAQLKSQDFPILDIWKSKFSSFAELESRVQMEMGMKLTCGFEILLSDSQYQDRPHVREMKLLLEDLDSGDATLPTNDELARLDKSADNEKWLDISLEDLQQELNQGKDVKGKKAEFGDKAAQENLQRIVKQFESFLNDDKMGDDSGLFDEGDSDTDDLDDIDSDDLEEDKDASFDEDEFSKLMQEMMGMPPEVMKELQSGKIDALANGATPQAPLMRGSSSKLGQKIEELSSDDDHEAEDADIQEMMKRMGAELKSSGALEISSQSGASGSKSITGAPSREVTHDLDSSEDEGSLDDMNEQLAKNLLESFQAQGGATGPAGNLMALMAEQYAREDEEISKKSKGKSAA